jgi:hypothetical protein
MDPLQGAGEEAGVDLWQGAEEDAGCAAEGFEGWLVEGVEDFEEEFVGEGQEEGLVGVWLVRGGVVVAWIGMVGVVVGCGWFGLVDERCDV